MEADFENISIHPTSCKVHQSANGEENPSISPLESPKVVKTQKFMREWMARAIHCLSCSTPAMTMILCMRFLCSARFRSMEAISPVIRHMAPKQSVSISFHRMPPIASHGLWIGTRIKNVIWLNAFSKNSSASEESSHVMTNWMLRSSPSSTLPPLPLC